MDRRITDGNNQISKMGDSDKNHLRKASSNQERQTTGKTLGSLEAGVGKPKLNEPARQSLLLTRSKSARISDSSSGPMLNRSQSMPEEIFQKVQKNEETITTKVTPVAVESDNGLEEPLPKKSELQELSLSQYKEAFESLAGSARALVGSTMKPVPLTDGVPSVTQQVEQIANDIVKELKNDESKRPFVLSDLGNNSREGTETMLKIFQSVLDKIEGDDIQPKEKRNYSRKFQDRVAFLCTGSAGKGSSMNRSVGKVVMGMKPELAKRLFKKDGTIDDEGIKELTQRNVDGTFTLTLGMDDIQEGFKKDGFKQFSSEKEVKFIFQQKEDGQWEAAFDNDEGLNFYPARKSGSDNVPSLLLGNTEAEFNQEVINSQLQRMAEMRKGKETKIQFIGDAKEGHTVASMLVEPNSINTGQNMSMGAKKVESWCEGKGLEPKDVILIQAQRNGQAARTGETALAQFAPDGGKVDAPSFGKLYNVYADWSPEAYAAQSVEEQAISVVNYLKEFLTKIDYTLGDPQSSFYAAVEVTPDQMGIAIELIQELYSAYNLSDDTKRVENMSLGDAKKFLSDLWPALEGQIKQGSEEENATDLVNSHASTVIAEKLREKDSTITHEKVLTQLKKTRELMKVLKDEKDKDNLGTIDSYIDELGVPLNNKKALESAIDEIGVPKNLGFSESNKDKKELIILRAFEKYEDKRKQGAESSDGSLGTEESIPNEQSLAERLTQVGDDFFKMGEFIANNFRGSSSSAEATSQGVELPSDSIGEDLKPLYEWIEGNCQEEGKMEGIWTELLKLDIDQGSFMMDLSNIPAAERRDRINVERFKRNVAQIKALGAKLPPTNGGKS